MHLCRHLRVARHLGVLTAQVRARTVHSSDLQGEEIIVGFQGPHNSSQTRPSAPQGRGRGRAQSSRGDRVSSSGVAAQQSGGRGTTQDGGRRGGHCYAFPGRPEAETFDAVITELGPDLTFKEEPIAILDRQVRKLRTKEIASVKVQWKHRSVREATWETESDMRARYPQLFEASGYEPGSS
nr:uncharacterized protein LOC104648458 isoform X3 [Solanum lycopersicum]XP_025887759.1 uncharacterized protein LOC104648458 isoform X3 [Solanum lycopersicum]